MLFNRKNKFFLPVIHPVSKETAMDSIEIAVQSEADGIFLINQGLSTFQTIELANEVLEKYPDLWIGLNLLGYLPSNALGMIPTGIKGIWADSSEDEEFPLVKEQLNWDGFFFGGVAFKYQKHVPLYEISSACEDAIKIVDVVTTSGPGTGKPAAINKIEVFREALGDFPLALASGVDSDNIQGYLPFVDAFLVGTSIEKEFGILDAKKTKELSKKIHNFS